MIEWITHATLLTQDSKRRVLKGHLKIENNRIADITSRLPRSISRLKSHRAILNAQGLTLIPGFVQAHVHLCQTLFRNQADDLELLDWLQTRIWPMEAAHTEKTLEISARLGIRELLSSGTTCILDMGTIRHTESIIEAVRSTGIRAVLGKCLMDNPKTCPENLREDTRSALDEAVQLFKRWNGSENDRIRMSYAPRFVVSCTEGLLKSVADLSKEQGALIHTHSSENQKEIEWVKQLTGQENIEYLHSLNLTSKRLVLAHCIWLKNNEMEVLKKTGTHVVHCPSSNLKLASGIAPIPQMREHGINIALGADGAPCNNNLNMLQEMKLAALIHKPGNGPRSIQAQEAFDMATLGGAKALNLEGDIGSIEIGKKADLVAFDLDCIENSTAPFEKDRVASLVYSTQTHHLHWTMVDGKLVHSKNSSKNDPQLLYQAAKARATIKKRTQKSI